MIGTSRDITVLKLGGSLLDLPDLMHRLEAFLQQPHVTRPVLVVGGGDAADAVRRFDAWYHLGPVVSHAAAIRAMSFNAHLVQAALRHGVIVPEPDQLESAWRGNQRAIVEPITWLDRLAQQESTIPARWSFTSDSIAAHIAVHLQAARLILLKSTLPPTPCDVAEAARRGLVDADFPWVSASLPGIELVNLRGNFSDVVVLK